MCVPSLGKTDTPIEGVTCRYNGFVSAGTFTHGHVGPAGLRPLLDIANSGAIFALSVNQQHFEKAGFERVLDKLSDQISEVKLKPYRIYDDRADPEHRDDIASLLSFTKRY